MQSNNKKTAYVLGMSGGKDSTACALYLQEQNIPFRAVFFDTGWEHDATYGYLDSLERRLGIEIEWRRNLPQLDASQEKAAQKVEAALALASSHWGDSQSAMVRWCVKKAMFPSRRLRWCTQEMKYRLARAEMQAEHRAGRLPVNVVGVRAEESAARARLPERGLDGGLDAMVWRPLLHWTQGQVVAIHQRHGLAPNPLYLRDKGARRVGCWPCIQCGKAELRLLARDEKRVAALELLEAVVGRLAQERRARNGAQPLEGLPAYFQASQRDQSGRRGTVPIRKHLEWAQTSRGGRQMLLDLPSDSGCMRWGMCDLPDQQEP